MSDCDGERADRSSETRVASEMMTPEERREKRDKGAGLRRLVCRDAGLRNYGDWLL